MLELLLIGALVDEAVDKLPEKAVTLDFVITKALESSDSFKAIKASQLEVSTPALLSAAIYDPTIKLSSSMMDDEAEPVQPFMPLGIESWSNSVSATGVTPFGQQIEVSLSHQKSTYTLTSSQSKFHQARLEAMIRQNLWKNFLGEGARSGFRAGKLASEALQAQVVVETQKWLYGFVELFHNAWLAQERFRAATSNLERRARLKKITDARVSRGSALQNDVLQVESAMLAAEVEKAESFQSLSEIWKALVMGLNLPQDFLKLDPSQIPMKLDSSSDSALKICKDHTAEQILDKNAEWLASSRNALSKSEVAKAESSQARISADLFAGLWASNSEPGFGGAFGESFSAQNPGWIVGAEIQVPLMRFRERAKQQQAQAEAQRAQALSSLKRSEILVRWTNECEGLKVAVSNVERLRLAAEKQGRRESLERRRFEMGDAPAFSVVQAGDDMTFAELGFDAGQIELRNRSWRIMLMSGALTDRLASSLQ